MLKQLRPTRPPSTQITLLTRLRHNGDAEAWTTFVDLYTPLVYRYCRSRHLQDADARDVTQQVLSIVHRWIGKFEYDRERGKFRNWLGAVTSHEITRHRRRDRRLGKGAGDGRGDWLANLSSAPLDPDWAEEFNIYILQRALTRIQPEFEREVWQAFDLTWIGDVKPRVAANQLGKAAAWIYKARFKVIERLRKELDFLSSDAAFFHKPA